MIELTPVQSSRIAALGYDESTFTLAVKFPPTKKSPQGKTYHYASFAPEQFEELKSAPSIGVYFGQNILNNPDHPFTCVDEGTGEAPTEAPKTEDPVYLEAVSVPEELPEDEEGLKSRALEVQKQAQGLVIKSSAEFAHAGNELKIIVAEKKKAQARVDEIKKPAYVTYQATLKLEKDVITPYTNAENYLKGGMSRYLQEEERERRRKEAELAVKAREEAEAEAKRKAAERAEEDAKALEAQGEPEVAAQVRANPMPIVPARVAPVVLQKEVPKVEGVSSRERWCFRITDETLIPKEYLMPNESAIRQVVNALKDKTNIAGVEVYKESTVSVRA